MTRKQKLILVLELMTAVEILGKLLDIVLLLLESSSSSDKK